MEHATIQMISGTVGLVIFVLLFVGVLTYALWPKNKDRFARAARLPLEDKPGPDIYARGDRGER